MRTGRPLWIVFTATTEITRARIVSTTKARPATRKMWVCRLSSALPAYPAAPCSTPW
jgi:hypothetical protein